MDSIDEIPILLRREIEARIAGPLIKAFGEKFGKEETERVAAQVILELAEESGAALATRCFSTRVNSASSCSPTQFRYRSTTRIGSPIARTLPALTRRRWRWSQQTIPMP